jgi:hypothetical protein
VIIEVQRAPGQWTPIGSVAIDEPPGSLASTPSAGQRDVYVFGWYGSQGPGVWRSIAGFDVPTAAARDIASAGLETIADLGEQAAEVPIIGRDGTATVRFTYAR